MNSLLASHLRSTAWFFLAMLANSLQATSCLLILRRSQHYIDHTHGIWLLQGQRPSSSPDIIPKANNAAIAFIRGFVTHSLLLQSLDSSRHSDDLAAPVFQDYKLAFDLLSRIQTYHIRGVNRARLDLSFLKEGPTKDHVEMRLLG